jgi:hypothetical protein
MTIDASNQKQPARFRSFPLAARWFLAPLAVGLVVAACSGDDASTDSASTAKGGSAAAGNGTGGGAASNGGGAAGNGTGGSISVGGSGGRGPSCGGEVREAKPNPAGVFLMVDRSGSMARKTAGGTKKWDDITSALKSFWGDKGSTGLSVGVQFFPKIKEGTPQNCLQDADCGAAGPCSFFKTCGGFVGAGPGETCTSDDTCGGKKCVNLGACITECTTNADCGGATCDNGVCPGAGQTSCAIDGTELCGAKGKCIQLQGVCSTRDSCAVEDYTAPAVDFGTLPNGAGALSSALDKVAPDGFTPMAPALTGAIARARIYSQAHPGEAVSVVLATDGLPSECGDYRDFSVVTNIAQEGASGAVPIKTYIIAVLSASELAEDGQQFVDLLASSGGTGKAFVIDPTKADVQKQFLLALNTIRGAVVSCDFPIPVPTSGPLDFGYLNVEYTPAGGTEATVLPRASGLDQCGTDDGWTFDIQPSATAKPTKMTLCPKTCATVQADFGAKVETRLGCPVVTKAPN